MEPWNRFKGAPDTIVDFWLGHAIGEMAEAYKGLSFEEVKRMYAEREQFISVSGTKTEISQIEKRLEEQNTIVQSLVERNKVQRLSYRNWKDSSM